MRRPLLLGHRGARFVRTVPENSLESFDLALQHGCHGFEFDVRITADGEAVVCHDAVWRPRVLGIRPQRGLEIARTKSTDLSSLAFLPQVIERYRETAFLDIELKVGGIEAILAQRLQSGGRGPGLVVSSFLPEILIAVSHADSGLPLGLICERREELQRWRDLPLAFVIPHYRLVTADLLDELHSAGKSVLAWTVNDIQTMKRLTALGVDGIISDETQLLVHTLGEDKTLLQP
jgi:glycerophosphoryl diester phosphodiesterase